MIFNSETIEDETEVIELDTPSGTETITYGATLVVGEPFPETEEPETEETEESEDEVESATAFGSVSMAAIAASLIILNQWGGSLAKYGQIGHLPYINYSCLFDVYLK